LIPRAFREKSVPFLSCALCRAGRELCAGPIDPRIGGQPQEPLRNYFLAQRAQFFSGCKAGHIASAALYPWRPAGITAGSTNIAPFCNRSRPHKHNILGKGFAPSSVPGLPTVDILGAARTAPYAVGAYSYPVLAGFDRARNL
jgi:hypothetical protein